MLKNPLIIITCVFLFSCKLNNHTQSNQFKTNKVDQDREAFKKNHVDEYNHWQKLMQIFKTTPINSDNFGIINCQNFSIKSNSLKFKQLNIYNILGKNYSWNVYETEYGDCLALRVLNGGFLLNDQEAKILLSASKGIQFEEKGLQKPKLIHQWTINKNKSSSPTICNNSNTRIEGSYEITENNCEKIINYISEQ